MVKLVQFGFLLIYQTQMFLNELLMFERVTRGPVPFCLLTTVVLQMAALSHLAQCPDPGLYNKNFLIFLSLQHYVVACDFKQSKQTCGYITLCQVTI